MAPPACGCGCGLSSSSPLPKRLPFGAVGFSYWCSLLMLCGSGLAFMSPAPPSSCHRGSRISTTATLSATTVDRTSSRRSTMVTGGTKRGRVVLRMDGGGVEEEKAWGGGIPGQEELQSLTRPELQALAKQLGVKANSRSALIVSQILLLRDGPGEEGQGESGQTAASEEEMEVDAVEMQQGGQQQQEEEEELWSETRCAKRIVVLQRKLRQVKDLHLMNIKDPDALNDDQLAKLDRRDELTQELSMMEEMRRRIRKAEASVIEAKAAEAENEHRTKFSKKAYQEQQQQQGAGPEEGGRNRASEAAFTFEQLAEIQRAQDEARKALLEPEPVNRSLPKRLDTALSYCRVSTTSTCQMLIGMGRVTVNGAVATQPSQKINLLEDVIKVSGEVVSLPDKIDNSAVGAGEGAGYIRQNRGRDTGGPKPDSWKKRTKYSWKVDGGLLARKAKGIVPSDGQWVDDFKK